MSAYPAALDYFRAVQAPRNAFTVQSLRTADFVWDALGPTLATGSSAVVFHATVTGIPRAIRCFIRSDADSRARYMMLGDYLEKHDLRPYISKASWLDDAIQVNGSAWPVLQMDWVDGRTLDQYVDYLVTTGNAEALAVLAARWREMITLLQNAEFAHGDLQHGNVLIDQEGGLRLVDFDGVFVPGSASTRPPTEFGHPNYQHPERNVSNSWGLWIDSFSALVIYLSLIGLSKRPKMWDALYNSKNLLFVKSDFSPPFRTAVWEELAAINDREVDRLASLLRACCQRSWTPTKSLDLMLEPPERPWWEKQVIGPIDPPRPSQPDTAQQAPAGSSRPAPPHVQTGSLPKPPSPSYQASSKPAQPYAPPWQGPQQPSGTGPIPQMAGTGTGWWQGIPPPQTGRQPGTPPNGGNGGRPPNSAKPPGKKIRRVAAPWGIAAVVILLAVLWKVGAFNSPHSGSAADGPSTPTVIPTTRPAPVDLASVFPDIGNSAKTTCSPAASAGPTVIQIIRCSYAAAPSVVVYYYQFDSAASANTFATPSGQVGAWSTVNPPAEQGPLYRGGYTSVTNQTFYTDRGGYTGSPYAFEVDSSNQAAADEAFRTALTLKALN